MKTGIEPQAAGRPHRESLAHRPEGATHPPIRTGPWHHLRSGSVLKHIQSLLGLGGEAEATPSMKDCHAWPRLPYIHFNTCPCQASCMCSQSLSAKDHWWKTMYTIWQLASLAHHCGLFLRFKVPMHPGGMNSPVLRWTQIPLHSLT